MISRSLLIAVFGVVRLVATQSLQDLQSLPQCAQTPAESAFAATGCGLNEPACVCKNADFQTSLTNEVMQDCSQTDQVAVLKFSTNFCAQAGITVNVPQTTEAAAQSLLNPSPAAASSSAPPPPPPPPPPPSSSSASPPPPPPPSTTTTSSASSSLTTSSSSSSTYSSASTSLSFFIAPAFTAVMTGPYIMSTSTAGQVSTRYPLASSSVVAYNGSNNAIYNSTFLSFTGGAVSLTSSRTTCLSLVMAIFGVLIW